MAVEWLGSVSGAADGSRLVPLKLISLYGHGPEDRPQGSASLRERVLDLR